MHIFNEHLYTLYQGGTHDTIYMRDTYLLYCWEELTSMHSLLLHPPPWGGMSGYLEWLFQVMPMKYYITQSKKIYETFNKKTL